MTTNLNGDPCIWDDGGEIVIDLHPSIDLDKVNWVYMSRAYKLSEDFIMKHRGRVHWETILRYQKLSNEFFERLKGLSTNDEGE